MTITLVRKEYEKKLDLLSIYKYLHENPELSNQEEGTRNVIAKNLQTLGFDVNKNIGGYGVVGILKNNRGPVLMIRTDMDALPIKEITGLSYASQKIGFINGEKTPIMHACGHDMHMSIFLGVAENLINTIESWQGTLLMLAQPAEEVGTGARDMLNAGLFERFPIPNYALSLHVAPDLPVGTVATDVGAFSSNTQSLTIVIKGIGGHAAFPHLTKDPIVLAAKIIMSLQNIISREISPEDPALISVGKIHGGTKNNIIPDEVTLGLSVRSYSKNVQHYLQKSIERLVINEARAFGLPEDKLPELHWAESWVPSIHNDEDLVHIFNEQAAKILGKDNVKKQRFGMAAEDFANYGHSNPSIKSLMFLVGAVEPETYHASLENKDQLPSLHSDRFAPDVEGTLTTGIHIMTDIAKTLFTGDKHNEARRCIL